MNATRDDRTFCSDGATKEPWGLADFAESNEEDPDCEDMLERLRAMAVGESVTFGGGAIAETVVTRLS